MYENEGERSQRRRCERERLHRGQVLSSPSLPSTTTETALVAGEEDDGLRFKDATGEA
jgi:hypothetical protein